MKALSLLAAGQTAAPGVISVQVAALTEGVLISMLFAKPKMAMAALLAIIFVAGGGLCGYLALASQPKEEGTKANRPKLAPEPRKPKKAERPKPTSPDPDRATATAWGKVDHGLQAGIRFPTTRNKFRGGQAISIAIIIRNVSEHQIQFLYHEPTGWAAQLRAGKQLVLNPLLEFDGDGPHPHTPIIEAGKEWPEKPIPVSFTTRPPKTRKGAASGQLDIAAGKYKVFCPNVLLPVAKEKHQRQLPTGSLTLEIVPAGEK
jgi:hypothetical protein